MTLFEPVREVVLPFGSNAYLEVARRRLRDEDGESEFLVVSRGFVTADGTRRWTKFVTIPDDASLKEKLAEAIRTT